MSAIQGQFCWYELITTDPDAAAAFYATVTGWTIEPSGMPNYSFIKSGFTPVGGMMAQQNTSGAPAAWLGNVAVDDVDALLPRVEALGGLVRFGPRDIPGIGRFARIVDPDGAPIILFQSASSGAPQPENASTPGRVGWHELWADEYERSFTFYSELLGWTRSDAADLGPPMGIYQMFAAGGITIGGMMTRVAGGPPRSWLYYVNVDGIDAAVRRVDEAGGHLVMMPAQVPGGAWVLQARDPQGILFALVSESR